MIKTQNLKIKFVNLKNLKIKLKIKRKFIRVDPGTTGQPKHDLNGRKSHNIYISYLCQIHQDVIL